MIFWNVAGIERQDKDFWKYISGYDYIGIVETWLDENGWERIKEKLPDTHVWEASHAVKKNKKGRARGGLLIGLKKGWRLNIMEIKTVKVSEGIAEILENGGKTNICTIYNSGTTEDVEGFFKMIMEEYEREGIIIGGDFNIRIGELGWDRTEDCDIARKSKDKIIGKGGKKFMEMLEEKGWQVLNGRTAGDWEGEYTYVGARGCSVIDYIIVNEYVQEDVIEFKIGERVDSDHMPVTLEIEKKNGRQETREENEEKPGKVKSIINWDKDARKLYKDRTESWERTGWQDARTIEEKWEKIKELVDKAMVVKEVKLKKRKVIGHKDWWNRSCTRKKRKVKRKYRNWKKGKGSKENYIEGKKSLRGLLDKRKKEKREEELEELKSLKSEKKVWGFINKRRKKKVWKENNIQDEEWRKYFMNLLGGMEKEVYEEDDDNEERTGKNGKVRIEEKAETELRNRDTADTVMEKDMGTEREEEEDLSEEEITEAIMKMKLGKVAGIDRIPIEAWRYGGNAVRSGLRDILRQIWKEGKMPMEWRKSIVVPLYKKGDTEKTENYRGISLLGTAYKVYAEILRKKLEVIVDSKELLPESQAGFRKGRSTIDNIFILNHIIQREKIKQRGENKVYALFIDLKAAFDNVDRKKLWEILEDKGVGSMLRNRIKGIYEETEMVIRTKKGLTESFVTKKGVRQGCVLSPDLFNLYIADLDKVFEERNIGGVSLGTSRLWTLAYADDVVLMAKNREALEDMMDTLKRFLKEES